MEELEYLIGQATATDNDIAQQHEAFGEIVRRFQDMAYGCAYAVLGDFQLAEDVAQEAFIEAYRDLPKLQKPKAFAGWFKQIVIRQCYRMTRKKSLPTEPLETALKLPSHDSDPAVVAEENEMKNKVLAAIKALPESQRMVTTLFYINGYSQNEIADFLEIPATRVDYRLRASRKRLKERMLTMVQDTIYEKRPSKDEKFVKGVLPGLEGVIADKTHISQVDPEKIELTYRGYNINDLANHATFEEVAYLLLMDGLPTRTQLDAFCAELAANRALPDWVIDVLRLHPKTASPMDLLRSGVSALGAADADVNDNSYDANLCKAKRLIGQIATLIPASHRIQNGQEPIVPRTDLGHAANLLYMLNGQEPANNAVKALDVSLTLYAEHGFNASTFTGRVIASTRSDMHSAIGGAIGALKGDLHGGANEKAMQMLLGIGDVEKAEAYVCDKLAKHERIMGFGHRVYRHGDSRVPIMSRFSKELGDRLGITKWSEMAEIMTDVMLHEKGLHPNVDFPCAYTYYLLGIPIELYTPFFVAARIVGWTAHIIEQHIEDRLIRPTSMYEGRTGVQWVPIDER